MNNLHTNVQNTDIIFTTIQDHTEKHLNVSVTSKTYTGGEEKGWQIQPSP